MPVLSRDREEDVSECSGWEISQIFSGKIRFLGNGIRERRPLTEPLQPTMYHTGQLKQGMVIWKKACL